MPEKKSSERGPDKGEAYGMGAVMQVFKGTEFPAKKEELLKKAGNQQISWTKGGEKRSLADLVRQAPSEEFPSMAQVVSAVSAAAKGGSGQRR
jgi:hypothetical protein